MPVLKRPVEMIRPVPEAQLGMIDVLAARRVDVKLPQPLRSEPLKRLVMIAADRTFRAPTKPRLAVAMHRGHAVAVLKSDVGPEGRLQGSSSKSTSSTNHRPSPLAMSWTNALGSFGSAVKVTSSRCQSKSPVALHTASFGSRGSAKP